jgi:Uma2 family endonuclease
VIKVNILDMTLATYKWTIDRYHQAVETGIFDDQSIELLQGEIVLMAPEGKPHTYFSDRLSKVLQRLLGERAQIRESRPITLPNNSEPEPDIAVVQPLDDVYLDHHPYPENIFLVIEYSNTTLNKDLGVKQLTYAEAGILEYWVVNLKDLELTIFRHPTANGYQSKTVVTSGIISLLAFPEISIEVQRMFSR